MENYVEVETREEDSKLRPQLENDAARLTVEIRIDRLALEGKKHLSYRQRCLVVIEILFKAPLSPQLEVAVGIYSKCDISVLGRLGI
jgi:hypothetical protein